MIKVFRVEDYLFTNELVAGMYRDSIDTHDEDSYYYERPTVVTLQVCESLYDVAQIQVEAIRSQALAKLTDAERKALGF